MTTLKELIAKRDQIVEAHAFTQAQSEVLVRETKQRLEADEELRVLNKKILQASENARLFALFMDLYLSEQENEMPQHPDTVATVLVRENLFAAGLSAKENITYVSSTIDQIFDRCASKNTAKVKERLKNIVSIAKPFLELQEKTETHKMGVVLDVMRDSLAKKAEKQLKRQNRKSKRKIKGA